MGAAVTLVRPNPANGAVDVEVGSAANPIYTQAVIGGTTSGTKLEDAAAVSGDAGSASLWVRRDTNATQTDANNDYTNPAVDQYGNVKDSPTPTGLASASVPNLATTGTNSALVLKSVACNLYGYNVVTGASAGYLMIFDAISAPADGVVSPAVCIPVAANTGIDYMAAWPRRFTVGCTLVFSTTGPFTKTASATAFLGGTAV